MQFGDFLGADEVKSRLEQDFSRFPHAVLLQGEPGCGKRTLARWIAAAAVCANDARRPCGGCRACARVLAGGHPDVRELTGTGTTGTVKVEQIRDLRQDALRPPLEAGVKVYIVPDADKLTEQAQNALLKTLEEPPAYVRFILTAPAKDRLLDTIVSRVQTFSLQTPPPAECAAWVLRNKPEADPEKVQTLSVQMNGNIGRVLAALQDETDDPALTAAAGVLGALLQPDENPLLQAMAPFSKDRVLFGEMMRRAGLILRDACVLRAGAKALVGGAPETAEKLAKTLPQKNLMTMAEICRQMETDAGRNANMALLSTVACAKLRTAAGK